MSRELKREIKKPLQVEVEAELLKNAKQKAKKHGLTMRQVIEHGLEEFLKKELDK